MPLPRSPPWAVALTVGRTDRPLVPSSPGASLRIPRPELQGACGWKPAGWFAQTPKSSVATPWAGPNVGLGHTQTTLSPAFFSDNDADDDSDLGDDRAVAG